MRKKNKIHFTITLDNKYDRRKVRDYLLEKFKAFRFVIHGHASFGGFSTDVVARDYEMERHYEKIPKEMLDEVEEKVKLEELREEMLEVVEKIDQKLELEL